MALVLKDGCDVSSEFHTYCSFSREGGKEGDGCFVIKQLEMKPKNQTRAETEGTKQKQTLIIQQRKAKKRDEV